MDWDFFFFFSFVVGCASLYQLGKVKEKGEVERKVVLQEFIAEVGRNVKSVTTIGGLFQQAHLPVRLVKDRLKNGVNGRRPRSASKGGDLTPRQRHRM